MLHRVQAEWGPFLGVEVSVGTSPRTASSKSSSQTRATSSKGVGGGGMQDTATTGDGTRGTTSGRATVQNEVCAVSSGSRCFVGIFFRVNVFRGCHFVWTCPILRPVSLGHVSNNRTPALPRQTNTGAEPSRCFLTSKPLAAFSWPACANTK